LVSACFVEIKSNTSLFIYLCGADTAYLFLYVNDIILTTSSLELLQRTTTTLQQEFTMKDLGPIHDFLDISVKQWHDKLFLHQRQYAKDILEHASMCDYKPCTIAVDTQAKASSDMGAPVDDPTAYYSLVGALKCLTITRLDISYIV
jgi:hypothetical protein